MNARVRPRIALLLSLAVVALGGCVSGDIVLQPGVPAQAPVTAQTSVAPAPLAVEAIAEPSPASKYEERSDKTLIGRSESLGVHLSDIWMEETPTTFVKRLVEASVQRWGYRIANAPGLLKLQVRITKLAMESRAINALQFQADGAIDADLNVSRPDGAALYSGHYRGACTQTTASETPGKEYLQQVFDRCVKDFQAKLESDAALRQALADARTSRP
jgi:hypothetical protein